MLASCSSDDSDGGAASLAENTFVYGNVQNDIKSVVYTYDQQGRVYTFYFSPTPGLVTPDAMLLADDYILIETNAPSGDVALGTGVNTLQYKTVSVSAESSDATRSASSLYLLLTSTTTVKMTLNVTTESGETLKGDYNGLCVFYTEEEVGEQVAPLDTQIFARYQGTIQAAGTVNYYLAVTNTKYEGSGTSFELTEEGYALVLDIYGTAGESWQDMPYGTFTESDSNADHTYFSDYSSVVYVNAAGEKQTMPLVGNVTIAKDETSGEVTINATYLDSDYKEHDIVYKGSLRITNGMLNTNLPQLASDLTIDGYDCQAVYLGDYFSTGSGMMQIVIQDWNMMDQKLGGAGVTLVVFGRKFNDPKDICLEQHTYYASETLEQYTWLPGTEVTLMGMAFPFGTYALYDDGSSSGLYTYGSTGSIDIAEVANGYKITFDLITADGFSVKGSYEGPIYIEDQSNDNEDDGSSTLESDLELDLSKHTSAKCTPSDDWIYVGGRGYKDISDIYNVDPAAPGATNPEYRCSYQYIEIGTEAGLYKPDPDYNDPGKLDPTDIFRIDLLVKEGQGNMISPGTYTVVRERFPVQMYPGVCLGGYQTEAHEGTRWLYIDSVIGNGKPTYYKDDKYEGINIWLNRPSMTGYASLYTGTVTVEEAANGEFTFTIDGEDVLHHKITGSWTGPVYLQNGEKAVSSGTELDGTKEPTTSNRLSTVPSSENAQQISAAVKAQFDATGKRSFRR